MRVPWRHVARTRARVAKLVDAADLKSAGREAMWVRSPPRAPVAAPAPLLQEKGFRYSAYIISLVLAAVAAGLVFAGYREWWWVLAVAGALAALGTWDLLQRRSTLRRNYPLLAHFRYGPEALGPAIHRK